jgi:hypothetical protein
MKKRMFAFGCSGTLGTWATAADFIGVNFDEYYNFGKGGGCNTLSMNRLIETEEKYNFNSETDFVLIMITGFGRFSVMAENGEWRTQGDLALYTLEDSLPGEPSKPFFKELKSFVDGGLWNYRWLIYRTWIAIKTIRAILKAKGIKHKFVMALDNSACLKDPKMFDLDKAGVDMVKDIYNMMDIKESYGEFMVVGSGRKAVVYNDGTTDGHPTQTEHFEYARKHFPEMITDKSKEFYNFCEKNFDWRSIRTQPKVFNQMMDTSFPQMIRKFE